MHRFKPVLAYLLALALCLALLSWVMKLWRADLRVPFSYDGDGLMVLLWAKTTAETGWYLHNDRLGTPDALDFRDFPMADNLHFLIMKGLAAATGDPALTVNLHRLLTFPLTALTTLFVLRRLAFSYPASVLGSQLYTFLPYHFFRAHSHLFLASYFLLPLMALVILRVSQGGVSFRDKKAVLASVVVCLLVSSAGVYYAFFACYLLLIAGIAGAVRLRGFQPLAMAVALVALTGLGVVANLTPSLLYRAEHGANPEAVERRTEHAELYGLKLTQLLLPLSGHRCPPVADLKAAYNNMPAILVNENDSATLGVLIGVGFLLTMGQVFRLSTFGRDELNGPRGLANGLCLLNLAAVLFATMGGLGTLFNFVCGSWLRCYNRISVFIAFFSLLALLLALESLRQRFALPRRSRAWVWVSAGLLLAFGILDQTATGPAFKPAYSRLRRQYAQDRTFVRAVEATLPEGAAVFQLAHVAFPEPKLVEGMGGYELLRAYLHSRTLRWSYGAMKGRDGDRWLRTVAAQPPEELARTLALAGFSGIWLDRGFYADGGARLVSELGQVLATLPLVSPDERLAFFPLGAFADDLRRRYSTEEWEALREQALHPPLVTWHKGFCHPEGPPESPYRWCAAEGEIRLANPSPSPRLVTWEMDAETAEKEPSYLWADSPLFSACWQINAESRRLAQTFTLPPGEHVVNLRCGFYPDCVARDRRVWVFKVTGFMLRPAVTADSCRGERGSSPGP